MTRGIAHPLRYHVGSKYEITNQLLNEQVVVDEDQLSLSTADKSSQKGHSRLKRDDKISHDL